MNHNVYFACAAIGGSILVLQTLLTMIGGGSHDGDAPHDLHDVGHGDSHDSAHGDAFLKFFTFKTIVAFVTFFGLAGLACEWSALPRGTTLVISAGAGIAALFLVAWLMQLLSQLQSSGNVELENAVGCAAQVYLRIPARGEGAGKITVSVQGRTIELSAVTPGPEIQTGAAVKIVALRDGDTLEVLPLAETVA